MSGRRTPYPLFFVFLAMGVVMAGCDEIPTDPDKTLNQIRQEKTLRVGYSGRPPWTTGVSKPGTGVEGVLLKRWAGENEIQMEWREATERELVDALERGEIDVAIAGFTDDTPWTKRAAMTRPYIEAADGKHVMLVPKGENRWLLELDRFLQRQCAATVSLLEERLKLLEEKVKLLEERSLQ